MAEQHLFYRYRVLQPRESLGLKRGRSTVLEWRTVRLSVAKGAAGSFFSHSLLQPRPGYQQEKKYISGLLDEPRSVEGIRGVTRWDAN